MDGLLPLKSQLDQLRKRAKEVERAIKEVLDNDAGLAMMHLGGAHHSSSSVASDTDADAGAAAAAMQEDAWELGNQKAIEQPATEDIGGDVRGTGADGQGTPSSHSFRRHSSWHRLASRLPSPPPATAVTGNLHQQLHSNSSSSGSGKSGAFPAMVDPTMSLEILLDNYLNKVGWLVSEIDEHLDNIRIAEGSAALQMGLLRTRVLRFELALSMGSFVVACAALVTGLFGMNLLSHWEHHPLAFWAVAAGLLVGMGASWGQLHSYGKRKRMF